MYLFYKVNFLTDPVFGVPINNSYVTI
jgi:hypothetical protein